MFVFTLLHSHFALSVLLSINLFKFVFFNNKHIYTKLTEFFRKLFFSAFIHNICFLCFDKLSLSTNKVCAYTCTIQRWHLTLVNRSAALVVSFPSVKVILILNFRFCAFSFHLQLRSAQLSLVHYKCFLTFLHHWIVKHFNLLTFFRKVSYIYGTSIILALQIFL